MSDTATTLPPDIEIARQAKMLPIEEIAAKLDIGDDDLEHYGKHKAKISLDLYRRLEDQPTGKLVLVTAITPTPAGEGKTTTSIGLCDGLNRIGKRTTVCLREPSLGPCFGMKGGAAGGGYAQVAPMEDINLHFTGDFHAIELAHNLLSAMLDNHIHHGNQLGIDPRRIVWSRVVDMNDRALRDIIVGLGGVNNSVPHESGFDITVASEVMAIFCLSESLREMKERFGRIIVAYTREKKPITAADLKAHGAMTVLLKHAIKPNLVQTLENNPALIHGGPFANIAHGCNSVLATKLSMRLSEYTVTEAGFGADLGAEKFFDIKCRKAGIKPNAVVIVATVRALKLHGGVPMKELSKPNVEALDKGVENLKKHIENIHRFGLPVVVAINHFSSDTPEEIQFIKDKCAYLSVKIVTADHWADGGAGAEELARAVVDVVDNTKTDFSLLVSRHLHALAEGRHHLPRNLRRHRRAGRQEAPRQVPPPPRVRLRPPADLHGEDAVFALDRSAVGRASEELRRSAARRDGLRRRRLRGRADRRHHDDARPAESSRRRNDRHRRERADRGAVLGDAKPQAVHGVTNPRVRRIGSPYVSVLPGEVPIPWRRREIGRGCAGGRFAQAAARRSSAVARTGRRLRGLIEFAAGPVADHRGEHRLAGLAGVAARRRRRREMLGQDRPAAGQNHRVLDRVAQFADVAVPRAALQRRDRLVGQRRPRATVLRRKHIQKWSASSAMSLRRSRSGGISTSNVISRKNKSSRNSPRTTRS